MQADQGAEEGFQSQGPYFFGKVNSILFSHPFISYLPALLLAESPHLVHCRDFTARGTAPPHLQPGL